MKKSAMLFVSLLLATQASAQQPLAITEVLLYKNGMAYIVRSGQLASPLSLTFHPEDMNDVLKSFTAWNPSTGALYPVGYTAGIPSSHMLGRFPFNLTGTDTGLGAFLTQVKGAGVRLTTGATVVQGALAAVQRTDRTVGVRTSSDYRLTVQLRAGSLQTVWLSDVRSVDFTDPALRDQLRAYLDVLAEARQDVTRQISVYPTPAAGPVRVSYLQQFPLWKTSYRIDLADRDTRIQGWAQIDNPTGESWNNVQVSLLSGSPVSFMMNLYDPLYTNRATIGVPGAQVASPRQYETAVRTVAGTGQLVGGVSGSPSTTYNSMRGGQLTPGTASAGLDRVGPMYETVTRSGNAPIVDVQSATRVMPDGMVVNGIGGSAMQSAALSSDRLPDATQIEDAFEYRFPFPVQLASRQSALLPFLQKTLKVERLSIFNAAADRGNPRLGARIENTTNVPFEPGPVTFFESGRYAGETVLAYLPRGEKNLVSFGVDHDIQIASRQEGEPETTARISVSGGVALFYLESIATTTYEIRNRGTKKTLVVEHPRRGGRELKGAEPWETTAGFYRYKLELTDGQQTELAVREVISRQTTLALSALSRDQLVLFGSETPGALRDKLEEIVAAQERLTVLRTDLQGTLVASDALYKDQDRLRENMKALADTKDDRELRKRYLQQLAGQEDQVVTLRAHITSVGKEIEAAEKLLAEAITILSWKE